MPWGPFITLILKALPDLLFLWRRRVENGEQEKLHDDVQEFRAALFTTNSNGSRQDAGATAAGRRRYRAAALISIALLCCLSSGCARRVTYVNSDHKLVRLEAGQPAPNPGVLMSEGYLSEIFEALGKKE